MTATRSETEAAIVAIDDANPRAKAVAVKDGKILALGKKDEVLKTKGMTTPARSATAAVARSRRPPAAEAVH